MGLMLLGAGSAGLAFQALLVYRRLVVQRLRAVEKAKRAAVRSERRRRTQTQRMEERSERARAAAAETARREKQAHDRQKQAANETIEAEVKTAREAELLDYALQLHRQSHTELAISTADIFSNLGWHVSVPDSEAPFELELTRQQDGGEPLRHLVRCVPPDRTAAITDLRALESWREHERAAQAYLVSMRGFDEVVVQAVRLDTMKITLVEAHLLALWARAEELPHTKAQRHNQEY